ncbi:patatin-like phospholipase family protein [Saprospira sp. CCB-QB6]|uniref:patatin-like phospholipase family protein n=1 Tax=Saprospira sp. CCB-QB6 TaxID=3023936 RepID=UPI00234B0470|nr:patatin-like phospholipase family protein [Saprospira sp. CCB-QB6]WCL81097.1 patatin-like phospholipase family protein [Saprospira sp. CCB-QB6]
MPKMQAFFQKYLSLLMYSFPVQLLLLHFKSQLLFLLLWLFLFGVLAGQFGSSMGFRYFMLDPEYMGEVSFWSFFIIGVTLGMFYMAWNSTTYILYSPKFPFLASLSRPFAKFSLNNFALPGLFILYYLGSLIHFQWYNEFADEYSLIYYCLGLILGFSSLIFFSLLYFRWTNSELYFLQQKQQLKLSAPLKALILRKNERMLAEARENPYINALRTDYYLTERLHFRPTRSVKHYDFKLLEQIFKQNHANALLIQSLSITALILMSAFVDVPYFRIPTASSVLILLSVLTTFLGALSYWLNAWRSPVLVILLLLTNSLLKDGWLSYENAAYGMDYSRKARYNYAVLDSLARPEQMIADKKHQLQMLDNWRKQFPQGRFLRKPKLICVAVSGGGQRAALWSMHVLREIEKRLEGKLMPHTVLMSGASGGMWGSAYFRELYYQKQLGRDINPLDSNYLINVSKDLSNAPMFTFLVNDAFVPWVKRKVNGYTYKQDRGYSWEQQFIENTEGLMDRNLRDYMEPEFKGQIPMMIISPIIINDGRYLYISPQPLSYMMRPAFAKDYAEVDAVDFGALFQEQNPYNLRFCSALRMSSTFPVIFPNVQLPSTPVLEAMDAGFRDNYGVETALRFSANFKEWIKKNTSGVLVISIRGNEKVEPIEQAERPGLGSTIFSPLSAVFDVGNLQDYQQDAMLGQLQAQMGEEQLDIVRFVYRPTTLEQKASLSLHLTAREKLDILSAIHLPANQAALDRLEELVK